MALPHLGVGIAHCSPIVSVVGLTIYTARARANTQKKRILTSRVLYTTRLQVNMPRCHTYASTSLAIKIRWVSPRQKFAFLTDDATSGRHLNSAGDL